MSQLTESVVEEAGLEWLGAAGWRTLHGPSIAPGEPEAERSDFGEVIIPGRLRAALERLNPDLPRSAIDEAYRRLLRTEGPDLVARNRAFHRMLVDGVTVEFRGADGSIRAKQAKVLDFDDLARNDFAAVNQFTVIEQKRNRRPDIVLFVNGLPLVVIELKNAADENATIWSAFQQLQTYQLEIPSLFVANAVLVISDGLLTRVGAIGAGKEWFKPWRTITGTTEAASHTPELQVALEGLCTARRLLDLVRDFIVYEDDGATVVKKLAGYHQYFAVQEGVTQTIRASGAGAEGEQSDSLPFPVVEPTPKSRYTTCAPLVPLRVAASAFGTPTPALDGMKWVQVTPGKHLDDRMFVARVTGRSMEPRIPDGAWCLFRAGVTGDRSGRIILAELADRVDPETGQRYTVKKYESEKVAEGDSWRHARVTLKPENREFGPIVLDPDEADRVRVVAEFVEVLHAPTSSATRRGDRRIGVVWHTQGSGKSLTMAFYAGRIIRERAMENPTVVVLTDRNDLDDQLFGTFSRCRDLLRQTPVQAESRSHLKQLLDVEAGGVVFTTIHKFFPEEKGGRHPLLSARRNIVVLADEAHRSQYDFLDGFARHMRDALPNASFIGFTGTPIEKTDANTRAVFGEYISVYDIQRAVEDGATVRIFYESRQAKLSLDDSERPRIDADFEDVTEGEETERKEKLKSKWAQLEAVVGAERRVQVIAQDIVDHLEKRSEALDGKAMIVCMSRRICVELYEAIKAIRPAWADDDDSRGRIKVIMTGAASDRSEWQKHIRTKQRREEMAKRFRDANDPFRIVIVRDMWLTGFDAPCLATMYLDKPMQGHGLMQAIARVNRVFRDKPGGLVVDYLGLSQELKKALETYTESQGTGRPTFDQEEAVQVLLAKFEVCVDMLHGFGWQQLLTGTPAQRVGLVPAALEHILSLEDGKGRWLRAVRELSQAFALSVPHDEALRIRDEVAIFQALQAALAKRESVDARTDEDLDHAVRAIISRAVAPDGVVDIFAAAGLKKPDISILSDEFLAEIRGMPHRNLAVELLQRLIKGEIKERSRRNVVQARSFAEMLEQTLRRYQNRAIEAARVIEELLAMAQEMKVAKARGDALGLNEDEQAFYDALETNDSAVKVLGDETLKTIARELVETVRRNVSIDWTLRENVRAHLRVAVKRILRKHGYPPDKQERATATVLEQAALLSEGWA